MRLEVIQCEICTAMHRYETPDTHYVLPDSWLTVREGEHSAELHFCSDTCLNIWLQHRLSGTSVEVTPKVEPQEKPACKARRFLLWDEQANSREGVQWADGSVTLQSGNTWVSWEKFKANHEGSGVQWIDQEVAE